MNGNKWMNKWTNETTSKGVIKANLTYTSAFLIIPWPNLPHSRIVDQIISSFCLTQNVLWCHNTDCRHQIGLSEISNFQVKPKSGEKSFRRGVKNRKPFLSTTRMNSSSYETSKNWIHSFPLKTGPTLSEEGRVGVGAGTGVEVYPFLMNAVLGFGFGFGSTLTVTLTLKQHSFKKKKKR